ARAGLVKTSDVTIPASSIEKRIFPPVFPSRRTVRTPPLRTSRGGWRATFSKQSIRELPPINHDYQPVTSRRILSASRWMRRSQNDRFSSSLRSITSPKQLQRTQLLRSFLL